MFDLDGTLTRHDTLMPYVGGFLVRHPWRVLRLPAVLPTLFSFILGQSDRGELKAALLRAVFGGISRAQVNAWTARYVTNLIERGLFADARASVSRHREQGDVLALLSASPDVYVPAIGAALGFADVTCTGVSWADERFAGRLTSPNRRGEEKARCLAELRRRFPMRQITAYGNSSADLPHLRLADHGVLVNGTRAGRRIASEVGVECRTWR